MFMIVQSIAIVLSLGQTNAPASAGAMTKAPDRVRDQNQTMQARQLLVKDPELATLNIGVIVQDRIATLWGPAPSAEIAFRAELCLRSMVELAEVRNELIVYEPLELIRRPPIVDSPAPMLPELLPPVLPKDVRTNFGALGVLTGQDGAIGKPPTAQPIAHSKKPANHDGPTATQADAKKKPTVDAAPHVQQLTAAIQALRQRTPAYRNVQFAVEGSRVYLRSTEANESDILQEAARAIARMPNVDGVIVLDNSDTGARKLPD